MKYTHYLLLIITSVNVFHALSAAASTTRTLTPAENTTAATFASTELLSSLPPDLANIVVNLGQELRPLAQTHLTTRSWHLYNKDYEDMTMYSDTDGMIKCAFIESSQTRLNFNQNPWEDPVINWYIHIINMHTGTSEKNIPISGHTLKNITSYVSNTGQRMLVIGMYDKYDEDEHVIGIWDAHSGTCIQILEIKPADTILVVTAPGTAPKFIISNGETVRIFNSETREYEFEKTLAGNGIIRDMALATIAGHKKLFIRCTPYATPTTGDDLRRQLIQLDLSTGNIDETIYNVRCFTLLTDTKGNLNKIAYMLYEPTTPHLKNYVQVIVRNHQNIAFINKGYPIGNTNATMADAEDFRALSGMTFLNENELIVADSWRENEHQQYHYNPLYRIRKLLLQDKCWESLLPEQNGYFLKIAFCCNGSNSYISVIHKKVSKTECTYTTSSWGNESELKQLHRLHQEAIQKKSIGKITRIWQAIKRHPIKTSVAILGLIGIGGFFVWRYFKQSNPAINKKCIRPHANSINTLYASLFGKAQAANLKRYL